MDESLRALIENLELVLIAVEDGEAGKPGLAIHLHGALASLPRFGLWTADS